MGNKSTPSTSPDSSSDVTTDLTNLDSSDGAKFDEVVYKSVVEHGLQLLSEGQTKAAVARIIFLQLKDVPRSVVLKAFEEGAGVTHKSAPTYYYNVSRQLSKRKS